MEIEELRQVYNLQFIQVTECKVLMNCKFPMAKTKGRGIQACMNMIDYSERNNYNDYNWFL